LWRKEREALVLWQHLCGRQDGAFADALRSVALGCRGEGEPCKLSCAAWKKVLSAGRSQPRNMQQSIHPVVRSHLCLTS